MSGQQMNEAPRAIDRTGGYYPVLAIATNLHLFPDAPGIPKPQGATHFTYDVENREIVDWLREVAVKSSRGRPSEEPESDLFPPALSVEGERSRYPGVGLYVTPAYEVIGQVAP